MYNTPSDRKQGLRAFVPLRLQQCHLQQPCSRLTHEEVKNRYSYSKYYLGLEENSNITNPEEC